MAQVHFRAKIDEYANRVLGVVKEKYGLRDKSQALNKFIDMYGEDFVEKEAQEDFITHTLAIVRGHHARHPTRKIGIEELDRLTRG